jgi:hypothetical protein
MSTDKPTRSSGRREPDWNDSDAGPISTRTPPPTDGVIVSVEESAPRARPFISAAADEIALAALCRRAPEDARCDLCDASLDDAASSGLLMWSRGGELRFEEPPLCSDCAGGIGLSAFLRWSVSEDESE